jgi:anti-anti-sigma factor
LQLETYTIASPSGGGDQQVLALHGEVDLATAPQLEAALRQASGVVVIDCESLEFIDASGLSVLVRALRHLDAIRLINATPMIRKVITLVELDGTLLDHETSAPERSAPHGDGSTASPTQSARRDVEA